MEWVALAYHIPSGASKNRVYIWRKLREYGAGSLRPGFAVLPDSGENRRRLRELSRKLKELGGDGTLMTLRLLDEAGEAALLEQFARQAREGYGRAIADGLRALKSRPADRRELGKIGRELEEAAGRDHFGTGLTGELRGQLEELMQAAGEGLREFAGAAKGLLGEPAADEGGGKK